MNKNQIIKQIADKMNITQVESKKIFETLFNELTEILSKGNSFTVNKFGTFSVNEIDQRKGFNPILNKWMMLPPKLKTKFKASDTLKDEVNKK